MAMKLYLHENDVEMIKNLLSDHAALCRDEDEREMAQKVIWRIEAQEGIDEWEREADSRLPDSYAEIEYEDMESEEAVRGCAFDDMNFMRYMER